MTRRQQYALDLARMRPSLARVQMTEWNKQPREVAECVECGHPYLFHFDAAVLGLPGVGCHGCGTGHRCARDTTSIEVVYYPKHDDAD